MPFMHVCRSVTAAPSDDFRGRVQDVLFLQHHEYVCELSFLGVVVTETLSKGVSEDSTDGGGIFPVLIVMF